MSLVPRYCPRCGGPAGHLVCPPHSLELGFDEEMFKAAAADISSRNERIADLEKHVELLRVALEDCREHLIERTDPTPLREQVLARADAALAVTRLAVAPPTPRAPEGGS